MVYINTSKETQLSRVGLGRYHIRRSRFQKLGSLSSWPLHPLATSGAYRQGVKMKKEQHRHHDLHSLLHHRRSILFRAAGFVLVFTLGYALGFLSVPRPSSSAAPRALTSSSYLHLNSIDGADSSPPNPNSRYPGARSPPNEEGDGQQLQPTTKQPVAPDFFRFRKQCAPPLPKEEILPTLFDRLFNGTSPFAGFPPPHAAPLLRPNRLRGWGSKAPVFQSLIEAVRPRVIVEVGTFLGASALHMANLTSDLGTIILCLDDFRGWPGFRRMPPPKKDLFKDIADLNGDVVLMYQFMQNVVASGEEDRVLPVPFSTASGLAALCEWGVYADLVEVDAGHDFHSAWQDINLAWEVVRPGGIMFGHDYHNSADRHGVRRAVDLFARTKGLRVQPNGQHWVLHPPKAL
ncbi:hypothetical protein Taro_051825 [Colocasia esculenta]|uniref:Uncharacterized protein n=1 Tax=Colocasia esculenta TaxID=4460 RepID=A0A843XH24_COLES|nr:hypothetical protein [Colocasia esculenta]